MKRTLEIALLATVFLASMGAVWYGMDLRWKRINTPEVVAQRKVDRGIREDLCERFERDLASFKETPQTFRRTTLKVLEAESRVSLRRLLISDGVPGDFPIEYKGTSSRLPIAPQLSRNGFRFLPLAATNCLPNTWPPA